MKFHLARPAMPSAPTQVGKELDAYIAWLDSRNLTFRVQARYLREKEGLKHLGDSWKPY